MNKEAQKATENRRTFLKETGKKALWAAPVVTMLMTASSLRAEVPVCTYGSNDCID